jgi:hemoglobin-like flavoprotein
LGTEPDGVAVNRYAVCGQPPRIRRARPSRSGGLAGKLRRMSLDLEALETSFDLVAPRGDELMDIFYGRLFAAAPAVRPLFAGTDLRKQKIMLLRVLGLLRKSLRDLESIVPILHDLGARHVAYGARPEHYPVVGAVLIASMAEIAGDAWQPGHERAWTAAFDVVAGAMLDGASRQLDIAA